MKVKELIEKLQTLDQEADIVVYHEDGTDYVTDPILRNDEIFINDDGTHSCEKDKEFKRKAFVLMGM